MSKTNYDIAHAFAYGATKGHTSNWNLFIEGDCIYSYGSHFCIAKHVGKGTILMTTRSYSVTTAKHVSYVRGATSHMNRIFCDNPNGTHTSNLNAYLNEIKSMLPSLAKARKPEKWIQKIQATCAMAEKYCEFFEIKMSGELAQYVKNENLSGANKEYLTELKKRVF